MPHAEPCRDGKSHDWRQANRYGRACVRCMKCDVERLHNIRGSDYDLCLSMVNIGTGEDTICTCKAKIIASKWKPGPPTPEPPLEAQTKESLIALARSLLTQAEEREKRRAALEGLLIEVLAILKHARDPGMTAGVVWLAMDKLKHKVNDCYEAGIDLDALTPAPEEKEEA